MTLVAGVGVNDLKGQAGSDQCPIIKTWRNMVARCYSDKYQINQPTYENKTVCSEWLFSSKFKEWMSIQVWKGLELDKDVLVKGNTEYSPRTCAFIPKRLNNVLTNVAYKGGNFPLGVTKKLDQPRKKPFVARVRFNTGKSKILGHFYTPEEAHKAWQWGKSIEIEDALAWYATQECFRADVAEALTQRVWQLRLDHTNNVETKTI